MAKLIPHLKRYPVLTGETLQAWDAADELLLAHVNELDLKGKRILILNDSFGALSSTLSNFDITSYTDSFVSDQGIRLNSDGSVSPIHELSQLAGIYDYVLIKLPKNLSFFEDELCHLTPHLSLDSKIICAAMVKYLPKTPFDLIQKYIGETTTSLAQKKARLIFASFQKGEVSSPYPLLVKIESYQKPFVNHSNLFSREKLDIGTRFLLDHIPKGEFKMILDLGCANGIIGIAAKKKNPDAKIIFCDESAMAIESARTNYHAYFSDEAQFVWTNCYENQPKESLDLVLCNPPFHQHQTIGDFVAWQMFMDSWHALRKGGLLRVVGNSHLGYPEKLSKIFGKSQVIANNSKFKIIDAIKAT